MLDIKHIVQVHQICICLEVRKLFIKLLSNNTKILSFYQVKNIKHVRA